MAHPIDISVGARVRELRVRAGLSQQGLARRVGLSFQQIQKYEKGSNRMGASRLIEIAAVLDTPIETLFDGLDSESVPAEPDREDAELDRDAAKVARDWLRIRDEGTREIVREMVRTLARTTAAKG